jgi:hypothetical protein
MWGDIKDVRLLYFKGFLFLLTGLLSAAGVLLGTDDALWRRALVLGICIWAWQRWYYFLFYVIEKYADPGFKFAGVGSFLVYLLRQHRRYTP